MTYTLDDLPTTSTPKDYSRIQFDPSQLPKERIVGILACQRDPLLRHLKTKIVSAERATIAAPPAQKGKNKTRRAATEGHGIGNTGEGKEGVLWEVVTEDTVIFPEGGGQPTDTGHLSTLDPNGGVEKTYVVEGCLRRKLTAVHLVRLSEGEELVQGAEVELSIDWDRRADHMAIHTAQHLLSAVLDTYELPTLSWSMTQYPSLDCPYIELTRGLTWKEVEEVEDKCNQLIADDLSIWVETNIQDSKIDGEGDRESRGIPKDYEGGVIRHINIDGIDRNACCGTQVPSLSHCSSIHLLPPSIPVTSTTVSKTPTRLSFTAGPRALRYLRHASRQLSMTAQAVGCGRQDVAERATRNEELRREGADAAKGLRSELAKLVTASTTQQIGQKKIVWIKRDEKTTHDFEFMGSLASGISASSENKDIVILLTSTLPGKDQTQLVMVQSTNQDKAKELFDAIKAVLAGDGKVVKGGGAKGRLMGKVEGKWGKAEDLKVSEIVEKLSA